MMKTLILPIIAIAATTIWPVTLQAAGEASVLQQAEAAYQAGLVAEKNGDPAAATEAYRSAMRLNPRHANARFRLGQVKLNYAKLAAIGREQKFAAVVIPEFRVRESSLSDALTALAKLTEEASAEKVTPNFIIQDPTGNLAERKVSLVMKAAPAGGILRYLTEMTKSKARHDEHAIVILPR